MNRLIAGLSLSLCAAVLLAPSRADEKAPRISWKKVQLDDTFRSEGCAVGDFNHDGKMDISAGPVYYAAPDWKMVSMVEKAPQYDPHNYSNSFVNAAEDVNGDGWTDLIVVDFPGKETWWFENPKQSLGPWKRHICAPVSNNESPAYVHLGHGRRELLMGVAPDPANFDGPDRQMAFLRPNKDPLAPWIIRPISKKGADGTTRFSHGLGAGDINGDGRIDVLVPQGWWEAPADMSQAEWTFHPVNFGEPCAQMYVYDFDGDGDMDVLTSSAHQAGIWWHEQTPDGWKTHLIDKSFSQTHSLVMVDINGDGLPDFVTGKRWWAHGPTGDVNPNAPAVVFWFELSRKDGKPVWTPHLVDDDSGVGTQFEVADVNGDGLLDIVTVNKKGARYFEQVREK
jgi:hypothetical protein